MYLIINENRHTVSRRSKTADTVRFFDVSPEPVDVSGNIAMYTDSGFLLSEDVADGYARKVYSDGVLTMTNEPEPEPLPEPEPEPSGDVVQYGELAEAIREGVNSLE